MPCFSQECSGSVAGVDHVSITLLKQLTSDLVWTTTVLMVPEIYSAALLLRTGHDHIWSGSCTLFLKRSFLCRTCCIIGASLSEPHSSEYYTEIPVLLACLPY